MSAEDYVRALEDECASANAYIGMLRYAVIKGDRPQTADRDYPLYEHYRSLRVRRFGFLPDREPQPSDGPEYHQDHAAWVERQKAHSHQAGVGE